ncbi:MAG: FemAB family PEP-CTERM system-associated protein [Gammaproteobacteria bacterium]|nr:FemAB family PEP-CTERM system-associated protein [Rhodocyclaceae bacterium]MBU3910127.1 FemAB family PEP-CTERM system-associated protein [Gammaproteobacteria bacterium]MBU3990062.1 FemAB family PEP-CTERM system-associated protein [Gammaproteobacteria bacterium]MBU4006134.1 FemAB family PEP-CTERM system-associated protein [Gammaproteobacteria bacterium]MBU4022589.1 FemAB family PEP-CTERM system-associated protein [Gammaproteobacteria bacterium]
MLANDHPAPGAAGIEVKQLDSGDRAAVVRWEAFVAVAPAATFFHRAGWQNVLRDIYRHRTCFLYAERNGSVVGILPLAQINSLLFGNALIALPFAVYGGVVSSDPAAITALEAEAERLAREFGVAHLEYRNIDAHHSDWPTQDLYVTFRKEILPDEEANLQAIPRKQRAMVRKGIKNGLRGEIDASADRFFALYADNVHRHGTPAMPKLYFDALLREFGEDCEVFTVVDAMGTPVSSVISFYFRDEVLPYYAGDAECARALAANDFKYWELMRRACLRGLKVFDYGRSKVGSGSYSFKKNWGFEARPLHYEYRLYTCADIPQNNPNNPKYKLMIAAWRRMPIALANFLGPFIVRNLG